MTSRAHIAGTFWTRSSRSSPLPSRSDHGANRKIDMPRWLPSRRLDKCFVLPFRRKGNAAHHRFSLDGYPPLLGNREPAEGRRRCGDQRIGKSLPCWTILLGVVLLLGAALFVSCGEAPTGIALTVDSNLVVPDEVDGLVVRIIPVGFDEMIEKTDLEGAFPHTLQIELESGSASLTIYVHGMKGEREVSTVHVQVRPVIGQVVGAKVIL